MEKHPTYNVYKGLQKPLIFKGLKGKYIYYGIGSIVGSLLLCAIVAVISSFLYAGITLIVGIFGGLFLSAHNQKKGLHKKDKRKGIFIINKVFNH